MTTHTSVHPNFDQTAVQLFALNDRLHHIVIEHLKPAVWLAQPSGSVRSIAAIFTHVHNVRCKWIRLTAPHLEAPPQLHRARCTPEQARAALAASASRCMEMLADALGETESRISAFRRDAWAPPWPAGLEMLAYMLTHEAHHRGQVCLLAHQLGSPLPQAVGASLWNWERSGTGVIPRASSSRSSRKPGSKETLMKSPWV